MRDLRSAKLMWLKAGLLLTIGVVSAAVLIVESRSWRTALLVACAVWGCCRAYYFAFYVIEHWIDPGYRYAGLWDFIHRRVLARGRGRSK